METAELPGHDAIDQRLARLPEPLRGQLDCLARTLPRPLPLLPVFVQWRQQKMAVRRGTEHEKRLIGRFGVPVSSAPVASHANGAASRQKIAGLLQIPAKSIAARIMSPFMAGMREKIAHREWRATCRKTHAARRPFARPGNRTWNLPFNHHRVIRAQRADFS
jgi:hypothetical protein